ncbi:hypothetical protein D6779_03840 [Candidatus Parcubacteria bacterium]|nr:MAG: hypothetical protein D6779_03840 [Candidatus Parcubacteria bacterium]
MLVDALQLVAAPAEEQVSSLPDFVCVTDEIAMTFGDAYLLVPQLERAGLVPPDAAALLKHLDDYFEAIPKDESLAKVESLDSHPFWAGARTLAEKALRLLGEERRPPNFSGIKWVKS